MVKTDANGRYRFDRLEIEDRPRTLMLGPPSAALQLGIAPLVPGGDIQRDFVVPRGVELTVHVRTAEGSVPNGATILLIPFELRKGDLPSRGRIDGEGGATFRHLRPGRYLIGVRADGCREHRSYVELSQSGTHEVELEPAESIVLSIHGWPQGVVGHVAIAMRRVDGDPLADSFSEAGLISGDGLHSWGAPPPGTYRIHVHASGFQFPEFEAEVADRGPTKIAVDLPAGSAVSGSLLDEEGRPISGTSVHLVGPPHGSYAPSAGVAEDGSWCVPLVPPGTYGLTVREGRQSFSALSDDITIDAAGRKGLELRLPVGGRIDGRIADFTASDAEARQRAVELSRRTADGWVSWGTVLPAYHGGFRARRLPAGRWRLTVESSLFADAAVYEPLEVDLRRGGHVTGVRIEKKIAPTVEFQLLYGSGDACTDWVTARANTVPKGEERILMLKPNRQGVCRVEGLTPGTWRLKIFGPEGPIEQRIEIRPERNARIEVRLWGFR
jgi:hypothetical protein